MKIIKDNCYKGTRILLGNEKRELIDKMIAIVKNAGFVEIQIPVIQLTSTFHSKVGAENTQMMYTFADRGNRDICLAPEYTAVVQQLAKERFKYEKDVKLFYVQECFRGENPQSGRYRQFTQFGVEVLNPKNTSSDYVGGLALNLIELVTSNWKYDDNAVRGLDYYKEGKGFEIRCPELGSVSQVCGGGEYDGGVGFAIGIDRLLLLTKS